MFWNWQYQDTELYIVIGELYGMRVVSQQSCKSKKENQTTAPPGWGRPVRYHPNAGVDGRSQPLRRG